MKDKIIHKGFSENPQGQLNINCNQCENNKCSQCTAEKLMERGTISEETCTKFCMCYRNDHYEV